ncbi:PPE family protein [Mycobacterium simiae]|uniref:PPE family protein n=1 Tax=Mycobacterium simiae TaxID=1784 RepID=A0A5B1BP60_MYCSI|nr:PPE family protein [Mycobacterium simiae]KAA1249872.1 PPE family protein [Mycobacterium simiae]
MFGPPEVITGRLMSGAGAAPMTAASAEFTAAAAAYELAIDRLTALLGYLSASWQGEAAMAMQRVVVRFIIANRLLQAQIITSAARTAAQAAAFTEAYTTMAQMAEIVENRVTTAVLHATNFLGMNTIPIGVKEGQYLEMWIRDVSVQANYLAQTMANTTFDPFAKLPPITGITSFPPVITQALNAAMAATDRVQMQAIKAQNTVSVLKGKVGGIASAATWMAQRAQDGAQKAEAQAAVARFRENSAQRETTDRTAEQMGQQLVQQIPQQAASLGQTALQAPQQVAQQVQQVGQQVGQQFGSQISNLMNQVSPEHRLDSPGFFDTQPSSSTLDRLAGSSGSGGLSAAIRVPSLAGLSGASTGFRFPGGWDGPLSGSAPPSAPASPGGASAVRPGGSGMPLHGARRRDEAKAATVKRPDTKLIAIWGRSPEEKETVSAGALVAERQTDKQEVS